MIFPEKEVLDLYQNGKNDAEIQSALGIHRKRIFRWRKKHGLPSNPRSWEMRKKYICYENKSDVPVCIGNASECARKLGYKSIDSFYTVYCKFNRTNTGKYRIYAMEDPNV